MLLLGSLPVLELRHSVSCWAEAGGDVLPVKMQSQTAGQIHPTKTDSKCVFSGFVATAAEFLMLCFLVCQVLLCSVFPGGRIYPVSVPYSSSQSTSKTSVTLSLVMPSQNTLTNGTNTASTLEEGTPTPG